jgi:hypothetical protein
MIENQQYRNTSVQVEDITICIESSWIMGRVGGNG